MTDIDEMRAWRPQEIRPADVDVPASPAGLIDYLTDAEDFGDILVRSRAIVFRDFQVTQEALDKVMDLLLPDRLAYVHGNSPRTKVGSNVYTSTEYPPEYTISMHNELSYSSAWPSRLMFYCAAEPETGGGTPIVHGGLWLASLDLEVRAAFQGGVRYYQYLHDGLGLGKSWQDTFETDNRELVDEFLAGAKAEWEWLPGGALRIVQVRPATTRHPVTGEEVWFNQADQWHPAALGDDTAAELARILPVDELPQYVTYADGSEIPAEHVIQVRDRGLAENVDVPWRQGDLMLIDNVAVGHGRNSFTGARRILVAMSS